MHCVTTCKKELSLSIIEWLFCYLVVVYLDMERHNEIVVRLSEEPVRKWYVLVPIEYCCERS